MATKIGLVLIISSIAFAEASLLDLIWKSIVLDRTQASATINCTSDGYMCSLDCQTVYQCIGSSPNFGLVTVEKCDNSEGYYCSTSLGKCSSTFSSTCRPPGYQFQCTSIGVFPDPYDCSVYHICYGDTTSPTDSEEQCETGWLYNAGSETCLTQASKCTEDPVPTCTAEGQVGPLESNPTIYYECVENTEYGYYYPVLYACPHGGEFDATLKSCVDRVVTYSPPTPTSTTELSSTEFTTEPSAPETSPETSSTELSTELSAPETSPETSSTEFTTEPSAPETSPETSSTELSTEPSAPETSPETSSTEFTTEPSAPETSPETSSTELSTEPSAPETSPETSSTELSTEPSAPETSPETSSTELSTEPSAPDTSPETSSTELSTEPSAPDTSPETSSTELSTEPSAPETSPKTSSTELSTEPSAPDTSPETSSTEPSTETETSTVPSSTTPAPFQCLIPGVFGDPYACQYYYRCTDDLEQYHYKCADGFHWNDVLIDCLYGPCLQ